MKLLRTGSKGQEQAAILDADGQIRSLAGIVNDIDASVLAPAGLARLRALDLSTLPVIAAGGRIGTPWVGCGKFICIGLNYADHAAETGMPIPAEPILFMPRPTSAIQRPERRRRHPARLRQDRLGSRAGRGDRHARPLRRARREALQHVAGYCVVNDVSEREFQLERGGTWDKGKGCDTFGPIGPWLVTRRRNGRPAAAGAVA